MKDYSIYDLRKLDEAYRNMVKPKGKSNILKLYRGIDSKYIKNDGRRNPTDNLWTTDDAGYAKVYGDLIIEYKIDKTKLFCASYIDVANLFDDEIDYIEDYHMLIDGFDDWQTEKLLTNGYNCVEFDWEGHEIFLLLKDDVIMSKRFLSSVEYDSIEINESSNTQQNITTQYPKYSDEQIQNIVRRNAWGEGRSGGITAMKDVIDTEFNRANHDNSNRVGVISAPKQFSAWNGMKKSDWNPETFKINNHQELKGQDKELWDAAEKLTTDSMKPGYTPSHNYTYYVTKEQYDKDWNKNPNRWYYMKKPDEIRGEHCFFTNKTVNGSATFNTNTGRLRTKDVKNPKKK